MADTEPKTPIVTPARTARSLQILAAVAVGALVYMAQEALAPVAIAILLSLVLATPVEALYRRGVPRGLSALLILLIFVGLVGESVDLAWKPAQNWWAAAPQTFRTIESRIRPMTLWVQRLSALTSRPGQAAQPAAPDQKAAPATVAQGSAPTAQMAVEVLGQTRTALVAIVTVGILTLFLMAGGPPMFAKMGTAFASDVQAAQVVKVIDAVRSEVGRYYASIALINVGLGLATAIVTSLLGMPTPVLWGVVAGVLNFIPYVGSATTLLLLTVTAFVSFTSLTRVAAMAGSYLILATIEGQFVQPLVVGRRLKLNPIIVFLALWFGGWFWGIAGIVLAIPTLVVLKVVAEHSEHGKPMEEFLSPIDSHGPPASPLRAKLKRRKS